MADLSNIIQEGEEMNISNPALFTPPKNIVEDHENALKQGGNDIIEPIKKDDKKPMEEGKVSKLQ